MDSHPLIPEPPAAPAQSEEVLRLLVEGVKDYAIFMLDTEGRVLTWNSGAERIKGYAAKEIIGRHFSAFYTAEASMPDIPPTSSRQRGEPAVTKRKASESARTARASGRMCLSRRFGTPAALCADLQR